MKFEARRSVRVRCGVLCIINKDVSVLDPKHHPGGFWSPLGPVLKHIN